MIARLRRRSISPCGARCDASAAAALAAAAAAEEEGGKRARDRAVGATKADASRRRHSVERQPRAMRCFLAVAMVAGAAGAFVFVIIDC